MSIKRSYFVVPVLTFIIPLICIVASSGSHNAGANIHHNSDQQTLADPIDGSQTMLVGEIVDHIIGGRPPRPGDRGVDKLCVLSPDPTISARDSFSTMPVFAWHPSNTAVDRITIDEDEDEDDGENPDGQESLIEISLEKEDKDRGYVFYQDHILAQDDEPLKRGNLYRVRFWDDDQNPKLELEVVYFYVLSDAEDARQEEQYQRLLTQMNSDPNTQAETMEQAFNYAQIFNAERFPGSNAEYTNLWMDTTRQILAIPELAPEFIEENYQEACLPSNEMALSR